MSDDQFTQLFKHMEKRFDELNTRFDRLQGAVDAYAKQVLELNNQEFLVLARKVDRLEHWLQQVAKKTGVELDY